MKDIKPDTNSIMDFRTFIVSMINNSGSVMAIQYFEIFNIEEEIKWRLEFKHDQSVFFAVREPGVQTELLSRTIAPYLGA